MSDADAAKAGTRRMDCVDCHNRQGHPYNPPDVILNALLSLKLDRSGTAGDQTRLGQGARCDRIHPVKKRRRASTRRSGTSIKQPIPPFPSSKEAAITAAIEALQRAYARNYDPSMKVSWKNFPNNQGHRFSPGCFRCHDGKHRSDDGARPFPGLQPLSSPDRAGRGRARRGRSRPCSRSCAIPIPWTSASHGRRCCAMNATVKAGDASTFFCGTCVCMCGSFRK